MTSLLQALQRQPEYVHVLLNPLPVYGLAMGWIGLVIGFFLRSRPAQIATLVLILISAASAWPVYEFGEQGYDRVLSMSDEAGQAWLDEHQHRGEQLIYFFYALAALSLVAIIVPIKWPNDIGTPGNRHYSPRSNCSWMSGYIAYAGGKIRHKEFRTEPPPKKPASSPG
jgi:hypothetical protein